MGVNLTICSLLLADYFNIITLRIDFLSEERMQLLWQASAYFSALCIFHLMEFFTTAIWNPTTATATSFLVNHSLSYTAAALVSWTEFSIRFVWFPSWNVPIASGIGFILVSIAQGIRCTAMIHCGESFNHIIQRDKKENHVLVTTGIYSILRHPSYVGFFYWSIATQVRRRRRDANYAIGYIIYFY
jgi:protein-S-isoprenylcysteine O-methyltransferase